MAARGVRADHLAAMIGISRNQTFVKLRGDSPWKASEVEALAEHFGVSIADLYAGFGLLDNDEAPPVCSTEGLRHRVRHQGLEPRTR